MVNVLPVCVDVALTRACGAMCSFCYAMVQEQKERSTIKVKEALDLVDGLAEVGKRSIAHIRRRKHSSKAYVPFIKHAANVGIDVGNATNWEWEPEKIKVLPSNMGEIYLCRRNTGRLFKNYVKNAHTEVFDR